MVSGPQEHLRTGETQTLNNGFCYQRKTWTSLVWELRFFVSYFKIARSETTVTDTLRKTQGAKLKRKHPIPERGKPEVSSMEMKTWVPAYRTLGNAGLQQHRVSAFKKAVDCKDDSPTDLLTQHVYFCQCGWVEIRGVHTHTQRLEAQRFVSSPQPSFFMPQV